MTSLGCPQHDVEVMTSKARSASPSLLDGQAGGTKQGGRPAGKILICHPRDQPVDALGAWLRRERYDIVTAPIAASAADQAGGCFAAIVVTQSVTEDVLDLARALRFGHPDTRLFLLGDRSAGRAHAEILRSGGNAHLMEPVASERLKTILKAAFRRAWQPGGPAARRFRLGNRIVDLDACAVKTACQEVRLTPTECRVFACLAAHKNAAVPHGVLAGNVWGRDHRKGAHSLRCFIRSLRRKVETNPSAPQYIVTIAAVGYRLQIYGRDDEIFT